jgi:hypothetical protein
MNSTWVPAFRVSVRQPQTGVHGEGEYVSRRLKGDLEDTDLKVINRWLVIKAMELNQ